MDGGAWAPSAARVHGGADAQGAPRFDFSTCSNAAGPCPQALAAVQAADATRYPDPESSAVRLALAALHDVDPARVLVAASASEFIQRFTAVTARLWPGAVRVPPLAYGDYAHAAAAWGRHVARGEEGAAAAHTLLWYAEPTSPCGEDAAPPAAEAAQLGRQPTVLDAVYAPLRLQGETGWSAAARDAVFVLHSPNKALALTGVRAAYAIAPRAAQYDVPALCAALAAATPSWPLSAQGQALLLAWACADVQHWVRGSHAVLRPWKRELEQALAARGFVLRTSVTPFFVAQPPRAVDAQRLRAVDVAVRDAASFGLPGWWRLSAQPPAAQAALLQAFDGLGCGAASAGGGAR